MGAAICNKYQSGRCGWLWCRIFTGGRWKGFLRKEQRKPWRVSKIFDEILVLAKLILIGVTFDDIISGKLYPAVSLDPNLKRYSVTSRFEVPFDHDHTSHGQTSEREVGNDTEGAEKRFEEASPEVESREVESEDTDSTFSW